MSEPNKKICVVLVKCQKMLGRVEFFFLDFFIKKSQVCQRKFFSCITHLFVLLRTVWSNIEQYGQI